MTGGLTTTPQLAITDPKVCKSYLAGSCPHDLFTNTKQDLGPCPKVHNEALKAEYEGADPEQKKRWGFDYDYMRDMQKYIDECNRKIDTAQRRLEKTPDEIRQTNALVSLVISQSTPGTVILTLGPIAKTNIRPNTNHHNRPGRNQPTRNHRLRQPRRIRVLQTTANASRKSRPRTRTQGPL